MFENIMNFFKKYTKKKDTVTNSKEAAKERLHLVLMQDRANVSADFLELMKQEIIDVIKKYIDIDESAIDVRLTNKENEDGTNGAPALYANIPIINIKNEVKSEVKEEKVEKTEKVEEAKKEQKAEVKVENKKQEQKTEKVEANKEKKEAPKKEEKTTKDKKEEQKWEKEN